MKRILIALVSLFFIPAEASHLLGGELYWECNDSGKYVFNLVLYRDCNGIALGTFTETINTDAPIGNISCPWVASEDISFGCYDANTYSSACAAASGQSAFVVGAVEKYTYRSVPIAINGTPPIGGWSFYWSSCCRPGSNQNSSSGPIYLQAKMYHADSTACLYNSPKFIEDPVRLLGPNGSFSEQATTFSPLDNVDHSFTEPLIAANNPAVWNVGYSSSAPFPDTTEDSLNGPVSIDQQTGEVNFNVIGLGTSSSSGSFVYAVKASSSRNGILIAETTRDMIAFMEPSPGANNPPTFVIDTSATYSHPISQVSATHYSVDVYMGDTLDLRMASQDFDFLPSGSPQSISFDASGYYLDTTWMPPYPLPSNLVSLTPVAPQVGFTSGLQNNVDFKWVIPSLSLASISHTFNFKMTDDHCPSPGASRITLQVNILNPLSISKSQISACSGDSVQLNGFSASGNYQWTPNVNISNNAIANPYVYPSTSGYYYLSDPSISNLLDSIYVQVDAKPQISLNYQNDLLSFTSNTSLDNQLWQYNGIGFNHPADSLTPFGSGDFWMNANSNSCNCNTNSISVLKPGLKAFIDPSAGKANDSLFELSTIALGVDFEITDPNLTEISGISMVGLSNGPTDPNAVSHITFKIYDRLTQNELWTYSSTITAKGQILSFPASYNLSTNKKYTLQVIGDTNLYIQTYQAGAFPNVPNNNDLRVLGAASGPYAHFPSNSGNLIPALTLNFKKHIGLEENQFSQLNLFPNPVSNRLSLNNLDENQTYEVTIFNSAGEMVLSKSLNRIDKVSLNTSALAPGLYIINLKGDAGVWNKKFIKN